MSCKEQTSRNSDSQGINNENQVTNHVNQETKHRNEVTIHGNRVTHHDNHVTNSQNQQQRELTVIDKIGSTEHNLGNSLERKSDIKMEIAYKEKDLNVESDSNGEYDMEKRAVLEENSEKENSQKLQHAVDAKLVLSSGKPRHAWVWEDDVRSNVTNDCASSSDDTEDERPGTGSTIISAFETNESFSSEEDNVKSAKNGQRFF